MFEKYSDSFLNNFNFDSLLEKFTNKKFLTFKEGEIIFCENSYIAEIYFILSGEVNLTKIKNDPDFCFSTAAHSGDILGFYDALTSNEYSSNAVALMNTNVFAVSKKEFLCFINKNNDFNLWALKYLSRRIEALD
ncbi:MAG: Crp/Fnr family transcriptional regulator [Ignavibacteria bacterium]|nr:Crp/Fnr family transcriptional regulator [Ignavibacteria bacterium]